MLADDMQTSKATEVTSPVNSVIVPIVHSTRLSEADAGAAVYQTYTGAELSEELNRLHLIPAEDRRRLLLEVSRRIERDGEFKVEKNKQRFGRVVHEERSRGESNQDEPVLEEFVIVRADADEEEVEAVRTMEVRKPRPTVRVSSGRAYSSQQ